MAVAVQLPALSPTMKEGRITKWLKNEGDRVTSGTEIAECETDKSNLAIEAYDDGVLLKILVKAGDAAPVGSTIAWIGKAGEVVPAAAPAAAPPPAAPTTTPAQAPRAPVAAPPRSPAATAAPVPPSAAPVPPDSAPGRLRASPLAKKVAAAQGVDLSAVQGSGPNGRIVRRDVEAALTARPAAAARAPGGRPPPTALPVTSMRKVIAQRLTEVKPGVPHFYLTVDIEMDQALRLREEAKASELKVSVNDIIVKAVGVAVRRFPRVNQVFAGDVIHQLATVDVGVAVAIDDGLITPIVKDADQKGLAELAAEVRDLAERAKKKALKPEEYTGGSITVSNLGMFGIDSFIAVINPPQASILAVGKVEPRVVVRDGQMVIRQMMSMTFSGDHRVVDGAVGAQFLKTVRELLEQPVRLLF
ncbi:MAG: pyruvate dehydrogenase complex dihydrolipoamide acetyltransferase [Myxococcaceae bacterium]|jgi:pyruvate dehydrogenase E2 component (dihydrolipoamide acetyltransferase)|nr:pyruvate dehydrogenase complex dihydrolipoamide acetyltransferase [Myxococcaceae bacterium]